MKGLIDLWCRTVLACALTAACAGGDPPATAQEPQAARDSVVPGTIGVFVAPASAGVVVAAVAADGPAQQAGMRVGDVVRSYDGVAVVNTRQFYRLMLESPPGRRVQMELLRDGAVLRVDVPVEETDTAPRG
ncbi:MAG TPA: PDZ domain-containing protein [Burkholderiales bacterium]